MQIWGNYFFPYNFSCFLFLLLFDYSCLYYPPLLSSALPTPTPTFNLPHPHCVCPWVLYTCSLMPLPLLSPVISPLPYGHCPCRYGKILIHCWWNYVLLLLFRKHSDSSYKSKKIKINRMYSLTQQYVFFLGNHSIKMKAPISKHICSKMFIAASFMFAKS